MNDKFQQKHQIIIAKYREIYTQNLTDWQLKLANIKEVIQNKK